MERNEEDWAVECSDDEKYEVDPKVNQKELIDCLEMQYLNTNNYLLIELLLNNRFAALQNGWIHKAEDIASLTEGLENNGGVLELEWKCPGRRELSPVTMNNHQQDLMSEYK